MSAGGFWDVGSVSVCVFRRCAFTLRLNTEYDRLNVNAVFNVRFPWLVEAANKHGSD